MVTWEFGANVVKIGERKKDEKWLPESWGRRGEDRQREAELRERSFFIFIFYFYFFIFIFFFLYPNLFYRWMVSHLNYLNGQD